MDHLNATRGDEDCEERPIVAGRIGPETPATAVHSIATFVQSEVELLHQRAISPDAESDLQLCAINAIMERRVLCSLSLMRLCGELTRADPALEMDWSDQFRADLTSSLEVAEPEIERHCQLLRLLLGPRADCEWYEGWRGRTLKLLNGEFANCESPELFTTLHRPVLVQELTELCVHMMQNYSQLDEMIAHNDLFGQDRRA